MLFHRCVCVFVVFMTFVTSVRADQGAGRPSLSGDGTPPISHYHLMPDVDMRVGDYQAGNTPGAIMIPVHVWGAAKTTGHFSVPKNTTLTMLLSYAQGPSVEADVSTITIKRTSEKTAQVLVLKVKDLISNPESEDVKMMPNDVVYLEPHRDLISKDWVAITAVVSALATAALAIVLVRTNTVSH